jgi:hypothetical protein
MAQLVPTRNLIRNGYRIHMGKRISPGTSCTVHGKPGIVQNGVGGGDYIVKMNDGQRVVVDGRNVVVAPTEESVRTDPIPVPVPEVDDESELDEVDGDGEVDDEVLEDPSDDE